MTKEKETKVTAEEILEKTAKKVKYKLFKTTFVKDMIIESMNEFADLKCALLKSEIVELKQGISKCDYPMCKVIIKELEELK